MCCFLTRDFDFLRLLQGYGPLIRTYVSFILAKLRFHRQRPEFNGLFEYKEYISLKEIDDPNEGYVLKTFLSKKDERNQRFSATKPYPNLWASRTKLMPSNASYSHILTIQLIMNAEFQLSFRS